MWMKEEMGKQINKHPPTGFEPEANCVQFQYL